MEPVEARALLELLEQSLRDSGDAWPALLYLAGREVELDDDVVHGAVRRSVLLLAAGGDPTRELEPDGRAVIALADELDEPGRRDELARGLFGLRREAAGLDRVTAALDGLLDDRERAWRGFACTLLASELDAAEAE